MKRIVAALGGAAVLLLGVAACAADNPRSFLATVSVSDPSGNPVSSCNVGFEGDPLDGSALTEEGHITDAAGQAAKSLRPGTYTVTVNCGGASQQSPPFEISDQDEAIGVVVNEPHLYGPGGTAARVGDI